MGLSSSKEPEDEEEENPMSSEFSRMSVQPQSLQPNKLRKAPVTILNEIIRVKAKLDESLVKENNAILMSFLDTFILEMKRQDKIFAAIFQKIYFTGSYYSDLRVSKPDEYDLNLLLKLPFKSNAVSVQYLSQVPSYVKYQVNDKSVISKELEKLFENGYLMPSKVRIWLQSVVDKALKTYTPPRGVIQVNCSASGPARTIILVKHQGVIDIDLVPAIECSLGLKPPGIDGRVYDKVKNQLECFLVPKPYQTSKQAPISPVECLRLWRAHYPVAESYIIHNRGCVKPVIKLLKLLRDKENWKILASYYLKTIILWMVLLNPSPDYWKSDRIGERLVEALKKLRDCVENRKICYFFSSKYNLLQKLDSVQASNISNRLVYILRKIEADDSNLWEIFGCERTFNIIS